MKLSDMLFANAMMGEGGGGGGGDFTTATVAFVHTFNNEPVEMSEANTFEHLLITEKDYVARIAVNTSAAVTIYGSTPTKLEGFNTYYNDYEPSPVSISATGDITAEMNPDTGGAEAFVSGNGTITINWE